MNAEDRLLFLRYALPCARTLVKRGSVSQDRIDELMMMVSENRPPPEGAERIFVVANAMCGVIAKRMGKRGVDSEVIREYFLFEHSDVVDDRFELMRDFDPVGCKTYPGRVVGTGTGSAVVETVLGRRDYRTAFSESLRPGDDVVVHYDYVIEKIDAETTKRMKHPKAR